MKTANELIIAIGPVVYINPDLITNPTEVASLVGIISWTPACAYPEYPSVSVRVTEALQWIKDKTGNYMIPVICNYLYLCIYNCFISNNMKIFLD